MKKRLAALVGASLYLTGAPADAMSCSILSVTSVAFGPYNVFAVSPVSSLGSIRYKCTDVGDSDSIIIHLSSGNASAYTPRKLLQGAYELDYNLYTTAGYTTVWGDGSAGTGYYGAVTPQEGEETALTIYGRIPAQQNARVGSYADTIVATVVF